MKKLITAALVTAFFSMNANAWWSFSRTKTTTRTSCTVGVCTIETCENNRCSYETYDDPNYNGSQEAVVEHKSDLEKLLAAGVLRQDAESVAALASQDLIDIDDYLELAKSMSHVDAMLSAVTM